MGTTNCKVAGMPDAGGLPLPVPAPILGPVAPSSTIAPIPSSDTYWPGEIRIEDHDLNVSGVGRSLRVLPSWFVSMFLHVVVLVSLACFSSQVDFGSAISLVVSQNDETELGEIEVNLEPMLIDAASAKQLDRMANELPDAAKLAMKVEITSTIDAPGLEALQLDSDLWGTTTGEGVAYRRMGEGMGEVLEEGEDGDKAQFFGISARGTSFIFVIDCSGSMGGPRWISARNELIRSMRSLKPDQQFCILLYSSFATSFEGSVNKATYVAATPENLDLMSRWLNIQIPGGGTLPLPAVKAALNLKPDAIFLLSDGELQDDTRGYLWKTNVKGKGEEEIIPVHTVSAGMSMGAQLLEVISSENHGKFQQVW